MQQENLVCITIFEQPFGLRMLRINDVFLSIDMDYLAICQTVIEWQDKKRDCYLSDNQQHMSLYFNKSWRAVGLGDVYITYVVHCI